MRVHGVGVGGDVELGDHVHDEGLLHAAAAAREIETKTETDTDILSYSFKCQ